MSSLVRIAARVGATGLRPAGRVIALEAPRPTPRSATRTRAAARIPVAAPFTTTAARCSEHDEETFEEFSARFEKEFDSVQDVFELQRNLNNCFAYDLVPSATVVTAALKAARRVNDFPTAVRIFEAIKMKVENRGQYDSYLEELKSLRDEYGISLKEQMYPDEGGDWKTMS